MKFDDTVRIVAAGANDGGWTFDPATNTWSGPSADARVVYEGACNAQAGSLMQASRRSTGEGEAGADGTLFLPKSARVAAMGIEPRMTCLLTYAPLRGVNTVETFGAEAEVLFYRPEDRAVLVKYR